MLDAITAPDGFLAPVARIVEALHEREPHLDLDRLMLVGAWCRDTLHAALGHDFATSATRDVDLALALSGWELYERLSTAFPRAGDSGIAFSIAGSVTDLIPFGEPEQPSGIIVPPTRRDAISVWAFAEIYRASSRLPLGPSLAIRCPTVPGYAAEELDRPRAAARLLGRDVAAVVGPERAGELAARWPGDPDLLVRNFTLGAGRRWLSPEHRRREVVDALTRGLADPA